MATIQSGSIQQSRFIGSPIMVPVQAASPTGNVTFHRVRLKVTVGDGGGAIAQNDAEFEFSIPVSNGTGSERGAGISNQWSEPARYSRKPTSSPEICFYHPNQQGESDGTSKHLLPGSTSSAPAVTAVSVPVGSANGSNIYGIPYPPHGHEIRFINSLGVHENIFVAGLPTRAVNITTDQYTIARQETLTKFSRAIAVKYGDRETWTFSSGPLDEAWVSWYIHEFLMVSWVWIDINDMWIPCHVLPEEQVTLVQHDKTDMLEVMLALKLDINGSPL